MLRVFLDHQQIGEFGEECQHLVAEDGHTLVILEPAGEALREVQRYGRGEWHGAGHGLVCGYASGDERADCENCHPPAPPILPPEPAPEP